MGVFDCTSDACPNALSLAVAGMTMVVVRTAGWEYACESCDK